MAVATSADGSITVGGNAVAEVTSFSFEQTSDTAESTAIGDTDRTYIATLKQYTASIEGHFDPADTNGQLALDAGSELSFEIFPTGETSGDKKYSGTGIVTSFSVNDSLGDMVSFSVSVQGTGALTEAAGDA